MKARHVVVDGSNIATEGRSMPSLLQLEEAVAEYQHEFPDDEIVVVVDATFGHRIDESERARFDEAVAHNEIVSPPAGAIGRGDAFLLRIADKVGATVLSNDSFQEFHGEHEWLFTNGRLIGGKPVPGVGWIFTPRTPVRGPKSRVAVAEAKRAAKRTDKVETRSKKVEQAIAAATDEAVEPSSSRSRGGRRRSRSAPPAEPINDPMTFLQFVATHKLGTEVEGEVDSFSSHGAFVQVAGARCYVPVSGMGDPPPRSAREVLRKGETHAFVVQALDTPRRGIELALPGFAHVSATPTDETVEDEIAAGHAEAAQAKPRRTRKKAAAPEVEAPAVPAKASRARKKAAALQEGASVVEPEQAVPAKAARGRKKAAAPQEAAPAVEPEQTVPAKAARSRKKAAAPAVEEAPGVAEAAVAKAARGRKKAAPAVEPEQTVPAKAARGRKKAAAPAVEEAPGVAEAAVAKAAQGPKKAAAPKKAAPAVEPEQAVPAKAVRGRKKAAAPQEAAPAVEPEQAVPAKAVRGRKKAAAPQEAAPAVEPEQAVPAKAVRGRRKAAAPEAEPAPEQPAKVAQGRRKAAAPEAAAAPEQPAKAVRGRKKAAAPEAEAAPERGPARRRRGAAEAGGTGAQPASRGSEAATGAGEAPEPAPARRTSRRGRRSSG